MNVLKLPLVCLLLVSIAATSLAGQQKRRTTEKPPAKSPAAPAPAQVNPVTFDTLIAADSFKIYGEVRNVGQIIRSTAATDVLEPILRLGGPPKEFSSLVGWLRGHADDLMTSRMLVVAWPTFEDVPDLVIAIELPSAEEATRFESQLNRILSSVLPPVPQAPEQNVPTTLAKTDQATKTAPPPKEVPKVTPPPTPAYHLKRADSLVLFSQKPLELKKLRPKDSKPLSENANFRVAYNRFSSEPIFLYVDIDAITKEQEQRVQKMQEQQEKAEEERKALEEKLKAEPAASPEQGGEGEPGEEQGETMPEPPPEVLTATVAGPPPEEAKPTEAQMLANAFSGLRMALFSNIPDLPNGVGVGFSPENESFELRLLLVNSPGESSDAIPIFTGIRLGSPISPESSRVLPASTELMLMMSIDYPDIHSRLSLSEVPLSFVSPEGERFPPGDDEMSAPLRTIEQLLKINIKDELLPVLGSELAISLPLADFNPFGPPNLSPQPQPRKDSEDKTAVPKVPIIAISIRDREAARQLLPKVLAGFGGKAAAALAQTERRDDTEIVSMANMFAYAFVGNFLILSTDAAATRYAVDSYLKGETLSADPHFRNSTRWQPRLVQGQAYISPAMAETYKAWANSRDYLSEDARNLVARLTANPQPISYSLSNDGLGSLHEVRVPRSIVSLAVAGLASSENPPETARNERAAMAVLWQIAYAERQYKEKTGTGYGSIEQLIASQVLNKENIETAGYKIDVRLVGEGFEITAVPAEYGKTGKLSFFLDQSGVVRGADHGGAAATASDQPINY